MTDQPNPLEAERRREFARRIRERTLDGMGVKPEPAVKESEMARAERRGREFAAEQCAGLSQVALQAIAPELVQHVDAVAS